MSCRFMLQGLSLKQYCELNGLNYKTQYNRVLEYAKKNPHLSDDEVTELAFLNYNKLFFEGMALANYCKLHNIDYQAVLMVIQEFREINAGDSDNQVIAKALKEVRDWSAIIYYKGMLLEDYCRSNPEVIFCDAFMVVRRELKQGSKRSADTIIDEYLENKYMRTYHFVEGIPLKEYCLENDIGYRSVLSRLSSMRRDIRFKHLSEQERLDIILAGSINDYFKCCLQFGDMSLYAYCKKEDISYKSVYGAMKRFMREDESLSIEEAENRAVKRMLDYKLLENKKTR